MKGLEILEDVKVSTDGINISLLEKGNVVKVPSEMPIDLAKSLMKGNLAKAVTIKTPEDVPAEDSSGEEEEEE